MHAHVWFEFKIVLLLHEATILNTAYDKRSICSVKQLSIKSGKEGEGGRVYNEVLFEA